MVFHVLHKSAGQQDRMKGNASSGMLVLQLGAFPIQVRDVQVVPQALSQLNVAGLKLGQFFNPRAGVERQQG